MLYIVSYILFVSVTSARHSSVISVLPSCVPVQLVKWNKSIGADLFRRHT